MLVVVVVGMRYSGVVQPSAPNFSCLSVAILSGIGTGAGREERYKRNFCTHFEMLFNKGNCVKLV